MRAALLGHLILSGSEDCIRAAPDCIFTVRGKNRKGFWDFYGFFGNHTFTANAMSKKMDKDPKPDKTGCFTGKLLKPEYHRLRLPLWQSPNPEMLS